MHSICLLMCLIALCGRGLSLNPPSTSQSPAHYDDVIRQAFQRADQIITDKTTYRKSQRRSIATDSSSLAHEMQQAPNDRSKKLHAAQERFEEAARIMLNEFILSPEQVFSTHDLGSRLPIVEVEQCKSHFTFSNCDPIYKYRTIDGRCNNMLYPSWGMASSCFPRLTKAYYDDGLSSQRKAVSGKALPNARQISVEIHSYLDVPSYQQTHMFMAFGQLLDHDITLTPFSVEPNTIDCCPPREDNPSECQPILISRNDPYYGPLGVTCMKSVRSASCPTCSLGPRQQTNQMTAYIDASHVYDVDVDSSRKLRNDDGTGTLRFQTSSVAGELLPPSEGSDKDFCVVRNMENYSNRCFQTGDARGNQHPALTSLQTMQLREHNRIARTFRSMTRWSDEKIYQEARRIVGAEMQMITYNEFLPHVLGPERMRNHDLQVRSSGYTLYDPTARSSLVTEFSSAAYRFGHTLVNSFAEVGRTSTSTLRLKDWFFYTEGLFHGQIERLLKGLAVSPRQEADRFFIPDLTNHLFQIRGNDSTGLDLATININRGRDHGIPPYTDMVKFCGGPHIRNFRQLDQLFQEGYSYNFEKIYENVADIDLYSGGLAEKPVPGGVVGPTFACVIGPQFKRLKFGDRFYFEHGAQAGSFAPDQLRELRKVTLSKLMCDNIKIEQMQVEAMMFPSKTNPVLKCEDLPGIDLKVWIKYK